MGRKRWVVEEQEERLKLGVKLFLCRFLPPPLISQDKQGVKQERRPFSSCRTGMAKTHPGKSSRPPWLETGLVQRS